MIIIVGRQNHTRVDRWSFPLSLNALLALLSTVYRGIIVATTAEVISQSKWEFFWSTESPQPLLFFHRFDAASRGIWGAIKLLPTAARRSTVGMISALIMLFSFAVGPFIQQSISIADRTFPLAGALASIPIAQSLDTADITIIDTQSTSYHLQDLRAEVVSKILSILLSPSSSDWGIQPNCTSGTCMFPDWNSGSITERQSLNDSCEVTHASTGVCSSCFNVTSLIQTYATPPVLWLPFDKSNQISPTSHGNWLVVSTSQNLSWAETVISTDEMQKLAWSFANVTILSLTSQEIPVAYTCSLYPCLRSYCGFVENNQIAEKTLKTEHLYPELVSVNETNEDPVMPPRFVLPNTGNLASIQSPCLINNTVYTTSNFSSYPDTEPVQIMSPLDWPNSPSVQVPSQCLYKMEGFFPVIFGQFFETEVFNATCQASRDNVGCTGSPWNTQFYNASDGGLEQISSLFDDISESLTKEFRRGLGREENSTDQVLGQSYVTKSLYITQWKWLSFPIIFMIVEIILLLWVIVRSMRRRGTEMVWKSCILPIMYYRDRFVDVYGASPGEPHTAREGKLEQDSLMTTSEMKRDAKGVSVVLLRGDGGSIHRENTSQRQVRVRELDSDSLLEVQR